MQGVAHRVVVLVSVASLFAAALLALGIAAAVAAPPGNDARTSAQVVRPPATVNGTTVEATSEPGEPAGGCSADTSASVWYAVDAPASSRLLLVQLAVAGDADATVELFRRDRGKVTPVDCADTDDNGAAELLVDVRAGQRFLVRVTPQRASVKAQFKLTVQASAGPATAPGPPLPRRGAVGTVERIANPDDAYSLPMRIGTTYRLNLYDSSDSCPTLQVFSPGTRGSFEDVEPVAEYTCGNYRLFTPDGTPGRGTGRYTLRVLAPRRKASRYRLTVAPLGADDSSPGIPLPSDRTVRGTLDGRGPDVVDLYRFGVTRRSDVTFTVGGDFQPVLLTESGRRIGDVDGPARLAPGRYLLVMRAFKGAHGRYSLRRHSRAITSLSLRFAPSDIQAGGSTSLRATVSPGGTGLVTITVERFDPLGGWQFDGTIRAHASGGLAVAGFTPRRAGRYRARASFGNSRNFSPSDSGTVFLKVESSFVP